MYKYEKNWIEINGYKHTFEHDIRTVIPYENTVIVLLSIPYEEDILNNLYCLDEQANLLWQSEDLAVLQPKLLNQCYERAGLKDDTIFATDFIGRCYHINARTGKIEGHHIVK